MILALCQLRPMAGDVAANVAAHLRFLRIAAEHGSDCAAFPELSLTGYEPTLAHGLAFAPDDARIATLRAFVASSRLQALVGAPMRTEGKPRIGAVWMARDGSVRWLGKQWLHDDELPFFSPHPSESPTIAVDAHCSEHMGFAICYELSCVQHAQRAFADGATCYLASVAKTARGVEAAHARLAEIARQHKAPAFMVNCVGPCDGVEAAGGSAAWDANGKLVASLPQEAEGILLVDTQLGTATALRA